MPTAKKRSVQLIEFDSVSDVPIFVDKFIPFQLAENVLAVMPMRKWDKYVAGFLLKSDPGKELVAVFLLDDDAVAAILSALALTNRLNLPVPYSVRLDVNLGDTIEVWGTKIVSGPVVVSGRKTSKIATLARKLVGARSIMSHLKDALFVPPETIPKEFLYLSIKEALTEKGGKKQRTKYLLAALLRLPDFMDVDAEGRFTAYGHNLREILDTVKIALGDNTVLDVSPFSYLQDNGGAFLVKDVVMKLLELTATYLRGRGHNITITATESAAVSTSLSVHTSIGNSSLATTLSTEDMYELIMRVRSVDDVLFYLVRKYLSEEYAISLYDLSASKSLVSRLGCGDECSTEKLVEVMKIVGDPATLVRKLEEGGVFKYSNGNLVVDGDFIVSTALSAEVFSKFLKHLKIPRRSIAKKYRELVSGFLRAKELEVYVSPYLKVEGVEVSPDHRTVLFRDRVVIRDSESKFTTVYLPKKRLLVVIGDLIPVNNDLLKRLVALLIAEDIAYRVWVDPAEMWGELTGGSLILTGKGGKVLALANIVLAKLGKPLKTFSVVYSEEFKRLGVSAEKLADAVIKMLEGTARIGVDEKGAVLVEGIPASKLLGPDVENVNELVERIIKKAFGRRLVRRSNRYLRELVKELQIPDEKVRESKAALKKEMKSAFYRLVNTKQLDSVAMVVAVKAVAKALENGVLSTVAANLSVREDGSVVINLPIREIRTTVFIVSIATRHECREEVLKIVCPPKKLANIVKEILAHDPSEVKDVYAQIALVAPPRTRGAINHIQQRWGERVEFGDEIWELIKDLSERHFIITISISDVSDEQYFSYMTALSYLEPLLRYVEKRT